MKSTTGDRIERTPPTRTGVDVQRAHDILVAVISGEVKVELDAKADVAIRAAVDVLCWVLDHPHNDTFARNLAELERMITKPGCPPFDSGRLIFREKGGR